MTSSRFHSVAILLVVLLVVFAGFDSSPVRGAEPNAEQLAFFENEVRPVLATRCFKCHGDEKQKGDLRLDSLAGLLQGGESGPAIEPGKPDESLLIEAINYGSYEMPPDGQLDDEEIAAISRWVRMGAPWPGQDGTSLPPKKVEPKITDADRAYWAFQPVAAVAVPQVADPQVADPAGWCRNPIDAFVLRRLQEQQLVPAPPADRRTLIRRAYFDLIGLPPSPAEIDAFLADQDPQAYEQLIDRLLERPEYGQRWARHWLDLVRYAESDGFKADDYRPHAWRYRDYVIRSFNDDKPYDQFVAEQLAGDELAPHDPDVTIATAYMRHGIYEYNQRDARTQWDNMINDVVDVTADVFLGLGMGCARCHDHKFDPLLQRDYFALRAFFEPMLQPDDRFHAEPEVIDAYEAQLSKWREATEAIRRRMAELEAPLVASVTNAAIDKFPEDIRPMLRKAASERNPLEQQLAELAGRQLRREVDGLDFEKKLKGDQQEEWLQLQKQLAEFDELKPASPPPAAYLVTDVGPEAPPTLIPGRSDAEPIAPGFPTVLGLPDPRIEARTDIGTTGRRTVLARWITDPANPLTSRVMVNRIWQYHFSRGLVSTASDFGTLGEAPSHPELLDWLAEQFVENGWSIKQMHRLVMNSATYRQSSFSERDQDQMRIDPMNRLLWKRTTRRLQAEPIRDAILAVTGELKLDAGGPAVAATEPRRTVYTKVIRNTRDPLLDVFDAPDGFSSVSQRNVTTTPTQALLLVNGPWMLQRAAALAKRLEREHTSSELSRIERLYRLAYGRGPSPEEVDATRAFLDQQTSALADARDEPELATAEFPSLGTTAIDLPANRKWQVQATGARMNGEGKFSVEVVFVLRSLYENAAVRTLASQWDSGRGQAGWSFGVTSKQSAYEPRNLILQLVGKTSEGKPLHYEVIASNLRPEVGKPYYAAVEVDLEDTSESGVTFYLKDLSQSDQPLQTAHVAHRVTDATNELPLVIGGRVGQDQHRWDGLIDAVRVLNGKLPAEYSLIANPDGIRGRDVLADWRFEQQPGLLQDTSSQQVHLSASDFVASRSPRDAAWIDLCHVILNSNEFLYID